MTSDWAGDLHRDGVFVNASERVPQLRTHDLVGQRQHHDSANFQVRTSKLPQPSYPTRETANNGLQAPSAALPRLLLRDAIRYVRDNLDSRLTWKDLASAVGVDEFKFGRAFKMSTGMTPHQYVTRCRLRRASSLLRRGEMTIADIALEVGCSCQSHLTTLFRKYTGTTPAAFRRAARASAIASRRASDSHLPLNEQLLTVTGPVPARVRKTGAVASA